MNKAEQEQRAKHIALDLLSRREHSSLELKRKLQRRKSLTEVDFDALCLELIENDWLSHNRFAEGFIRGRRNKGQGPVKIRYELKQRGLQDAEFIDILDQFDDWSELAFEVLARKFTPAPGDVHSLQKQQRFLSQRGFQYEHIRNATDKLNRPGD